MLKRDYFLKCMNDWSLFSKLDWIISAFSVSDGEPSQKYDGCLIQGSTGHSVYIGEDSAAVQIEDAVLGEPLYKCDEALTLQSGDMLNVTETITTTYGRALFNQIVLIKPFGKKIKYINRQTSTPEIVEIIEKSFDNDPKPGEPARDDVFYVSEYLAFSQSCFFLTGLTQLFTWAATEKNILPAPGMKEYKAQLLAENKDKLDDPVVIADIQKKLVEFDAQWRKGDPGNRFLITKKSVNLARMQKVMMYGAETISSDKGGKVHLHAESLYEGWTPASFTTMCTTARLKSFSRGAETALGGVEVKWLLRASGNINVTIEDCGSALGTMRAITADSSKALVGFHYLINGKPKKITAAEDLGSYLGKSLMIRSPMYCNMGHTDYCRICVGPRLSSTPYALSSAISAYGSAFLLSSLGAAHSKAIEVAQMDLSEDLV